MLTKIKFVCDIFSTEYCKNITNYISKNVTTIIYRIQTNALYFKHKKRSEISYAFFDISAAFVNKSNVSQLELSKKLQIEINKFMISNHSIL